MSPVVRELGLSPSRCIPRQIVYPVICCLIPLACIFLANPFASGAFIDDWSYADVALKLAQTGHLHYNGWGSPMLLFQTFWGALWIRAFGFSFDLLRIITMPFSIGFIWLVYLIGRRAGLTAGNATFGALVVGTSPLFLPLEASFMTEPYACFFSALCIYTATRGAESRSGSSAAFWLWVLTLSGAVGGAERQSVWAAPITLIPYLFWTRRGDPAFRRHAAACYLFLLSSIALLAVRFTQPYGPLELSPMEFIATAARNWHAALASLVGLLLSCGLVALPALLCYARARRTSEPAAVLLLLLGSAAAVFALTYLFGASALAPFRGDVLTPFGILWIGEDALGYKPVVLAVGWRFALSVLVVFCGAAFGTSGKIQSEYPPPKIAAVFGIFSCSYAVLLFPGIVLNLATDRYVLPVVAVLAIYCLARFQGASRPAPLLNWAVLFVFAGYAVASTHDCASALRARIEAARMLQVRGIPRESISAGFEFDGWTQLQATGRIMGARQGIPLDPKDGDKFWFWAYATAVKPDYVVMYAQGPSAVVDLPSLAFKTWLPPFRRYVTVRRRADSPTPSILP